MTQLPVGELKCPVGEPQCPVMQRLIALEAHVQELTAQTRTDNLTQLFNQRHLMICLHQEIERTQRTQLPTSLFILDIDHFKQINDSYGHAIGDQALIHLAKLLKNAVRKLDIPCRQGGEEFAVILPSTPILVAKQIAERVRQALVENPLQLASGQIDVRASFGVSSFLPNSTKSLAQWIEETDALLYEAKRVGRNCVKSAVLPASNPSVVSLEEKALLADSPAAPPPNRVE
ncbi:MAG TPA: GGDEF domain-containing protein [Cellvibrionaceae bacterium]